MKSSSSCSLSRGPLFLGAAALLLLLLIPSQVAAKPRSYWDGVGGIVKACDDFDGEGEIVASGAVTFLRPMQCKTPMVFHIYNATTIIRSHDVVNTTNVHFVVHPGGNLAFNAKAVVMARDEGSELPLIKTSDKVKFDVKGWTDAYTKGGLEDQEGVFEFLKGGELESKHPVHFKPNVFAVANEEARNEKPHTIKLSPKYEEMLKDFHAGHRSPQRDPADTDTIDDGSSDPDEMKESVGVMAARKASRANAGPRKLTAEYRVSSRVIDSFIQVLGRANTNTYNAAAATPPAPPPAAAATTADTTTADTTTDNANSGETPASTPPFPALDKLSTTTSKDHWAQKRAYALHVGEELTGTLKSEDGRSAFWPGVDGSLRFGKFLTPVEEHEGGVGYGVIRSTSLLSSASDKAREALILRRELQMEGGGEGGGGGDGKGLEGKGEVGGSWFAWRGASKRRQRKIAEENLGEVCVSVNNKGCVKVTVDGTPVLSRSGRFQWDWMNTMSWRRPTDEGYEVHVTESGIEVRLEERPVWGITAGEW